MKDRAALESPDDLCTCGHRRKQHREHEACCMAFWDAGINDFYPEYKFCACAHFSPDNKEGCQA